MTNLGNITFLLDKSQRHPKRCVAAPHPLLTAKLTGRGYLYVNLHKNIQEAIYRLLNKLKRQLTNQDIEQINDLLYRAHII